MSIVQVSIMRSVGGGDGVAVVVEVVVSSGQRDAPLVSHSNIGPNLVGRSVPLTLRRSFLV